MNEEDIKLFEHNEKAYKSLVESLNDYPLALIEHATGTGKSFIALKYLYVMMRAYRILYVSLHDEMFDQLFGKQMATLGMKREDFREFATLIYHNIIKQDPKKIVDDYDCIVFDEAHHCGAPKWSKIIEAIKEEVLKRKDKKMIGLTATSIRYLDNYLDVGKVYFDDHVASRLSVVYAMLKELLPAPLYINSISSCKAKYDRVKRKLVKLPRTEEVVGLLDAMKEIGKNIEDNSSIASLLKKYNVSPGEKYIVFCKDLNDLRNKKRECKEWFKDIGEVKIFEAHSAQKKDVNRKEISEFEKKRDEISLMFAVDIFNEGFHIDDLDGILMFRKTASPIVYLQQIGRLLSFSARKKQVKIFDFVDNISDNDIIRELYKELVNEAKRLAIDEPENKAFFEEIIKRFEIVDYTLSTNEKLDNIEAYLDENFTFRNSITRAIGKLQQYRDLFPNNDIQYDIRYGKLDLDYLKAYNHIVAMDKYLTLSNIEMLNNLHIDFAGAIITDIDKRRMLLRGYSSYNEADVGLFNEFQNSYVAFIRENNHRPEMGHSEYEDLLYQKYRDYLTKLSKKELMSLLNKFNFRLTVEELVLIGNYPNKDDLYAYFETLVKKLANNEGFDAVELKVLKKLKTLIPMEFYQLKDYLDHNRDINSIIDAVIKVFKKHEMINKQNKMLGYVTFINPNEVVKARSTLTRYANHVTNEQFIKLLELKIELPKVIDMSLEERLEKLGNYNSFYEKEMAEEADIVAKYFKFIEKNKRRPDENVAEEKELAGAYDEFLLFTSVSKIKIMCATLDHYHIPHSFLERALLGEKLSESEVDSYVENLLEKKKRHEVLSRKEVKILRFIYNKQKCKLQDKVKDLLNIETVYQKIYDLIARYEFYHDAVSYNRLMDYLKINNEYITKDILVKLKSLNIRFAATLENMINNLGDYDCIKEKKLNEKRQVQSSLEEYIRENKKRPKKGSKLNLLYRKKLARMSKLEIQEYLKIFDENNLAYTVEEKILLEWAFKDEIIKYLEDLDYRVYRRDYSVDELDKRVLSKVKSCGGLDEYPRLMKLLDGFHKKVTIEDRMIGEIDQRIMSNPHQKIDYDSYSLSVSSKNIEKLEEKRVNILINRLFKRILLLMNSEKRTLDSLDDDDRITYDAYVQYRGMNQENIDLLGEIEEKNKEYLKLESKLYKETFLNNYIEFIRMHNGQRPNFASDDMEEVNLASRYELLRDSLTRNDVNLITRAIKDSESDNCEEFYQQYIDFINSKGRMPCGNSDDASEVRLNNLYLNFNGQFNKEQKENVRKLKKTYSKATMQATISFGKKKG